MAKMTWTDERLDDLAHRTSAGFDRADRDSRDLRSEMHSEFSAVRSEFAGVRGEIGSLRGEVDALRSMVFRVGGGIMVSVITAALLHGI